MDFYYTLLIATLTVSFINMAFGLIRTYYARYAKATYKGSVDYWNSWQKRKYDVAVEVLKEMGLDSPEDIKKLMKRLKKEKPKRKKR